MKYQKFDSFEEIEKGKFSQLMLSGFGKKLVDDYFDYVKAKYICLAVDSEEYIGAIVVEEFEPGLFYLDKIVVANQHQGNGIGKELWNILNGDGKKLIWRAKPGNKIHDFYYKQCDGLQKVDGWFIYWKGLLPDEMEAGIKYALNKKPTLEEIE